MFKEYMTVRIEETNQKKGRTATLQTTPPNWEAQKSFQAFPHFGVSPEPLKVRWGLKSPPVLCSLCVRDHRFVAETDFWPQIPTLQNRDKFGFDNLKSNSIKCVDPQAQSPLFMFLSCCCVKKNHNNHEATHWAQSSVMLRGDCLGGRREKKEESKWTVSFEKLQINNSPTAFPHILRNEHPFFFFPPHLFALLMAGRAILGNLHPFLLLLERKTL